MTALAVPLQVFPWAIGPPHPANPAVMTDSIIDALGEYVDYIGYVYWDGEAASKVVSSAGGAIVTRFGAVTFANAGTTLRLGIQDVDAATGIPARGDGTHDVSADLVGGTDTITANVFRETAMETGTKTITHGQLIAIRAELTARAGADSLRLTNLAVGMGVAAYPAVTHNTAAPAAIAVIPNMQIKADDGTIGWLAGGSLAETVVAQTFDSGTATADEYASIVEFPFELAISGLCFLGRWTTAGGLCKAILYSAPLGTPVAEREVTIDTDQIASTATNAIQSILFSSAYTVPANTKIALSLQPQDASGDTVAFEFTLGSAIAGRTKQYRALGGTWSKGTRLNATGALSEDVDSIMAIGALVNAITTGAGAGGGMRLAGHGGLASHG